MVKEAVIGDMRIVYERIERPVKYPRLEFKTGKFVMIAPRTIKNERELIEKKKDWIVKKTKEIDEAKKRAREKHSRGNSEISELEMREIVSGFVEKHAENLNVYPNRLFFRSMKTKWGSCSSRGNLSFNKELRFLPKDLIEYVVYHEVIHLKERKHGDGFWRRMKSQFPDSNTKEKELMDYWFLIQEFNNSDSIETQGMC